MTAIYDKDLQFHDVEIPPINWVVVDVKAPRPAGKRSRDIDFRVTVCSERKLDAEEKEEVMKSANYEYLRRNLSSARHPMESFTEIQIWGMFNGKRDEEEAMELARDVWVGN
ncbi:hypothetical protein OS493_003319 [Desmophyllum pertusum]|uniref:Uncharacterized protein n=1 Tax=Desmophyllum pertusum TaxID=174260 RepID=A0A9X0A576_9CNID|nr:hypothetical protein OS493_003319 [Desmophyllum pertusum]